MTHPAGRLVVPALVIGGLMGLAACGGGPSKSGFLREADDTCRSANATVTSLKTPSSFPELADGAKAVVAATDAQVPRLRDLDRPGGDKDETDAVFDAIAGVGTAARSLQEAADRKDERATAQAANDMSARGRQAGDGARAYGFGTCGVSTQAAAGTVADGAKGVIKAGFVVKAEALCNEASDEIAELPNPVSLASLTRFLEGKIPVLTGLVADLEALTPPPGDEAEVVEFLDAQKRVIDKDKELLSAARDRDERLARRLDDEVEVLVTAANNKADELGINDCGTDAAF